MDARGRFLSVKEALESREGIASWVISKPPACIHNSIVTRLRAYHFFHNIEIILKKQHVIKCEYMEKH